MKFSWLCILACGGARVAFAVSCTQETATGALFFDTARARRQSSTQIFQVKGVVVELDPDGRTVKIKHEEIPGYMGAMTMPFEARPTNELSGLSPGDTVSFRMSVTDTDGWIDQIKKLECGPGDEHLPTTGRSARARCRTVERGRPDAGIPFHEPARPGGELESLSRTGAGHHVHFHALSVPDILSPHVAEL
jgi:Cu/Ag efflux protein CusF